MELILHIGTEKTGTSTIQEFLFRNQEKLMDFGYYYVQSPGKRNNRALPAFCMREHLLDEFHSRNSIRSPDERAIFDRQFAQEFLQEIGNIPEHVKTVLISSEHFHSRCHHADELQTLRRLTSRYFSSIQVVVYLRAQVEVATSLYSTSLKFGGLDTIEEFFSRKVSESFQYFDYEHLLNLWSGVFGKEKVVVSLFHGDNVTRKGLLADFFESIGLPYEDDVGWVRSERQNESLTPFGQLALRLLNKHKPRFSEEHRLNELHQNLRDLIIDECSGPGVKPVVSTARETQALFDEVNENVRKIWFPSLEKLFEIDFSQFPVEESTTLDAEQRILDELLEVIGKLEKRES